MVTDYILLDRVATGISGINNRKEIFQPVSLQPVIAPSMLD